MRRHALRAVALGAALTLGASAQEVPAGDGWETDLVAATARAAREARPLAVVLRCEP